MCTTMHERLGVMPHVVEAALGHVDGHRSGVSGIYNQASLFRAPARRAGEMGRSRRIAGHRRTAADHRDAARTPYLTTSGRLECS